MSSAGRNVAVADVVKSFGSNEVLHHINLQLPAGSLVGLVGPNGAGKSTLVNLLAATLAPSAGRIQFGKLDIRRCTPQQLARLGVQRTFQHAPVLPEMLAWEYVLTGSRFAQRRGSHFLRGIRSRVGSLEDHPAVAEWMSSLGLNRVAQRRTRELAGADLRLLDVARTFAGDPWFVMLDEPAAGLSHDQIPLLLDAIRRMNDRGASVMVIEHNMTFLRLACPRMLVLANGTLVLDGPTEEVFSSPEMSELYLGTSLSPRSVPTSGPYSPQRRHDC